MYTGYNEITKDGGISGLSYNFDDGDLYVPVVVADSICSTVSKGHCAEIYCVAQCVFGKMSDP